MDDQAPGLAAMLLERFLRKNPLAASLRLVLEQMFAAEEINALFERERGQQYTRQIAFSTIVDVMTAVVTGRSSSVHAELQKRGGLTDEAYKAFIERSTDPFRYLGHHTGQVTLLRLPRDVLGQQFQRAAATHHQLGLCQMGQRSLAQAGRTIVEHAQHTALVQILHGFLVHGYWAILWPSKSHTSTWMSNLSG